MTGGPQLRTPQLRTPRLLLRRWHDADRDWFAAMNADPRVMEYFPAPLSREQSDAFIQRMESAFALRGFGLWAVELTETGTGIGFTGLAVPTFAAHFTPAVEIGWRFAAQYWGAGYATEAARAALDYGFRTAGLPEVVSMTATGNQRSQAVMRRLDMTRDTADDFDHPALPVGHRLRRHVLYRTKRPE